MNQFGQMGMQSMGQRSTPPLPHNTSVNQVGVIVSVSVTYYVNFTRASCLTLEQILDTLTLFSLPNYCEHSVICMKDGAYSVYPTRPFHLKRSLPTEMVVFIQDLNAVVSRSRWVWEQQGWVNLMQRSYRTSTSLQASSPGLVQDAVLELSV